MLCSHWMYGNVLTHRGALFALLLGGLVGTAELLLQLLGPGHQPLDIGLPLLVIHQPVLVLLQGLSYSNQHGVRKSVQITLYPHHRDLLHINDACS